MSPIDPRAIGIAGGEAQALLKLCAGENTGKLVLRVDAT